MRKGDPAGKVAQEKPPLSPQRAFVVEFREGAGGEREPFWGKVEHIVSGKARHFHSVEELVGFIGQVLSRRRG